MSIIPENFDRLEYTILIRNFEENGEIKDRIEVKVDKYELEQTLKAVFIGMFAGKNITGVNIERD